MFQKLRKCVMCGADFPVVSKHSAAKICPSCRPEYNRKRSKDHYQRAISTGKIHEYRAAMRDRQAERMKNPSLRLIARAKTRARAKGVEFRLVPENLHIPDACPILGTEFKSGSEYAMSIDAIDPTKGYTPENVQIISMKANAMKNSASQDELIRFAKWVLDRYDPD